ncbi:hypothetical protein GCM10020218_018950 [Dactylosporangium vinaceum]|uniref:DUF6039 family protein n=1 Tax=Dactylosporangium vinaceum TaxID=53362 RepID=A0ABV5MKM7_9ACTN|nr:DUF6039 family protein [Dactylosporangium vinaceum]
MTVEHVVEVHERRERIVPPAQHQTSLPSEDVLHSANSGVVVERIGQVRAELREEAWTFARELAERINTKLAGEASMFVYEETFGTKDRLHFLLHLTSLDAYYPLVSLDDEALTGQGPAAWNRLFEAGSVTETVMLPQFWGMYGTKVDGKLEKQSTVHRSAGPVALPPARQQTALPDEQILHSGNAGIVMHRTGQIIYDFRSEARAFGREVAESINKNLPGECTVFVYEEGFGTADRLHWLIHLKDLTTYMRLLKLHVSDEEVRDIYFRERIAPEKGGGTWARYFVEGSMVDVALTPLR